MTAILGALGAGHTAQQILRYLSQNNPALAQRISAALNAGHTIDHVLNFLAKNEKKFGNLVDTDTSKRAHNLYKTAQNEIHPSLEGGINIGLGLGAAALGASAMLPRAGQALRGQLLPPLPPGQNSGGTLGLPGPGGAPGGQSPTGSPVPQPTVQPGMNIGSQLSPGSQISPASPPTQPATTSALPANITNTPSAPPTQSAVAQAIPSSQALQSIGHLQTVKSMLQAGNTPEAIATTINTLLKGDQRKQFAEMLKSGQVKPLIEMVKDIQLEQPQAQPQQPSPQPIQSEAAQQQPIVPQQEKPTPESTESIEKTNKPEKKENNKLELGKRFEYTGNEGFEIDGKITDENQLNIQGMFFKNPKGGHFAFPEDVPENLKKKGFATKTVEDLINKAKIQGINEILISDASDETLKLMNRLENKGIVEKSGYENYKTKFNIIEEKPIEKKSIVATPHGVGEVKAISGDNAIVEIDGKATKVPVSELEAEPEEVRNSTLDFDINSIPEDLRSAPLNEVYTPANRRHITVKYNQGLKPVRYLYYRKDGKPIDEDFISKIKEGVQLPITSGMSFWGGWDATKSDSRGAANHEELVSNAQEEGKPDDPSKEYWFYKEEAVYEHPYMEKKGKEELRKLEKEFNERQKELKKKAKPKKPRR